MKNNLLFDFKVDKSTNKVFVTREFSADQSSVWDAFTKQEILDKWWAPKPWTSQTKYMNFEEGGRRFYAMVSPEGIEHWSIQDFTFINPQSNFKFMDAFTDKDENINKEMPSSEWDLKFIADDETTTVNITVTHQSLHDLKQIIEMGFQEGFTMALNYLETLLSAN